MMTERYVSSRAESNFPVWNMSRSKIALALLACFAVVWSQQTEVALVRAASEASAVAPAPDKAMQRFPEKYPRPISQWQSAEKARYEKLLSSGQFDVIVVPFQVQNEGFHRSINSLMTAQLARAIEESGTLRVADPYLTARALGEGQRRVDPEDVYRLAKLTQAKLIVWGYAGHRGRAALKLMIQWQEKPRNGPIDSMTPMRSRTIEEAYFGAAITVLDHYQSALPQLLQALGLESEVRVSKKKSSPPYQVAIPNAPNGLYSSTAADPLRDAYYFQLLAALAPGNVERAHERFVEKSLLSLMEVPPDSLDYRYLKARILMQLGMRPAALHVLGKPRTSEEEALHALLNGNLPDVRTAKTRISSPLPRLLAEIDAAGLAAAYDDYDAKTAVEGIGKLNLVGEEWSPFVARALGDLDNWKQFDNLALKRFMDADFPLKGYTLESIAGGAAVTGDTTQARALIDLSIRNHVSKLWERAPQDWCCTTATGQPTALDFIDLVDALATGNLLRRIYFYSQVQGKSDHALEILGLLDAVYKDHPSFTRLRSVSEWAQAAKSQGAARDGLLRSAYVNAFNAYYWEQGQTFEASQALTLIVSMRRNDYGTLTDNPYVSDYPIRPYYATWTRFGVSHELVNLHRALQNATYEATPFFRTYFILTEVKPNERRLDGIFKSIDNRFAGNGQIASYRANNALRKGDIETAEREYRAAIEALPGQWAGYRQLTELLYREGRVQEAAQVAMNFPDFAPVSSANKVGIANNAVDVGSLFYWSGHFAEAIPLYEIAANLNTGADSSLASDLRLKLLNGDYLGAAQGSYDRATRYNSPYAFRDYLGLLHVFGYSKQAWDAFNVLVTQFDGPQVWETALVGHRVSGATESEIIEWAGQDQYRSLGVLSNNSAKYLLRAVVTDRSPSTAAISAIERLDAPVWKVSYIHEQTVRASRDGQRHFVVGPRASEGSQLPIDAFSRGEKVQVKSELVYFAQAYKAMREQDFEAASALLNEAATRYDLSQPALGYILPYAAFAAAKSGDTAVIETKISSFEPRTLDFDLLLAKAVLTGIAGNTKESLAFLHRASVRRPFTELRPIYTEYQFAEICEWLYESTGKSPYRDIALDWVKKNQKSQPWFSWTYAMEAKLTTDASARRKAIQMANYLDPGSQRLQSVSKKEIEAAVKGFHNPFLNAVNEVGSST